jgi:hypothetical protein
MQVDVLPTVLARLGLPRPSVVQGVDLLGPDWPAREIWSEVDNHQAHLYARRTEAGAKSIHDPRERNVRFKSAKDWEHFDLTRDAGEAHDLGLDQAAAFGAERDRLRALRAMLEEFGRSLGAAGSGELGSETQLSLERLGYAGE